MVGHGSKFDRKKEAAVAALLTQRNIEEAARVAGIGTQTLYRWLKVPEFQEAYREVRRASLVYFTQMEPNNDICFQRVEVKCPKIHMRIVYMDIRRPRFWHIPPKNSNPKASSCIRSFTIPW
jgi:hypothetical protein